MRMCCQSHSIALLPMPGYVCYLAWPLAVACWAAFRWPSERAFQGRKADKTFRPSAFRDNQAVGPTVRREFHLR